jgi:hypothetical protein
MDAAVQYSTLPDGMRRSLRIIVAGLLIVADLMRAQLPGPLGRVLALAQERLCDTQFHDCREPLLNLIRNERLGIDVAFWFRSTAARRLGPCVRPLIVEEQGAPTVVGSGVLLRIETSLFLLTAAHVPDRWGRDLNITADDGAVPIRGERESDIYSSRK